MKVRWYLCLYGGIFTLLFLFLVIILTVASIKFYNYVYRKKRLNKCLVQINNLLDSNLKLKNDLLNIINKYMKSEKTLITSLNKIEEDYKNANKLNSKIENIKLLYTNFSSIIAIAEAYPNLIKDPDFISFKNNLQNTKSKTIEKLKLYNNLLTPYINLSNKNKQITNDFIELISL